MIKLRYREYPNGAWQDWSQYLVKPPSIGKRVESDKPGTAGVVAYDDAELVLRKESGNPVDIAFNRDLTSVQRYLMEIYCPNSKGQQRKLFEGMADFGSLDEGESSNVLALALKDKLSALQLLEAKVCKTEYNFKTDNTRLPYLYWYDGEYYELTIAGTNTLASIHIKKHYYLNQVMTVKDYDQQVPLLNAGETIRIGDKYFFIKSSYLLASDYNGVTVNDTFIEGIALNDNINGNYNVSTNSDVPHYRDELYGVPIAIKQDIWDQSVMKTLSKAIAFDGIKIVEALVKQQWPEITLINRTGSATLPIPLEYFSQLIYEDPFNTDPYGALKLLAGTLQCYMYINKDGNLVLQNKKNIGSNGITRTLGTTAKIDASDRYFWDKLADGVNISVKSWVMVNGETITGKAQIGKTKPGSTAPIRPRNPISRDVLASASDMNTQEAIDAFALQVAQDDMDFYGVRHGSKKATLDLDDNILGVDEDPDSGWDVLDNIVIDGNGYFWPKMDYDLSQRTLDIEFVGVEGHDYYPGQVSVPYGDEGSSGGGSYSGGSSSGGGTGVSYLFNYPLERNASEISLLFNEANLRVDPVSHKLDTIQSIGTSASVQHGKLGLGMACGAGYFFEAAGSGHFTGDLIIDGSITVNGPNTIVYSSELVVGDKNITLGASEDISDITAAGGGFTLLGSTDKSFIWNNDSYGWTSSEAINLAAGRSFRIGGTEVLKSDTLGAGVVNSSLTKVGTLTQGTWQATAIDRAYIAAGSPNQIVVNGADGKLTGLDSLNVSRGGTGLTTFTVNKIYKGNGVNALQPSCLTDDGANLTCAPTGVFYFDTGSGSILPKDKYFENLGSLQNKFLTLHVAELWSETLVAQNTIATIGGRVLVAPTTTLIADVSPTDGSITVKHNNLVSGDIIYMESSGKVEYMVVDSGYSAVSGGYSYAVMRDVDGSSANQWYAGDAVLNTQQTGGGFIDIYSVRGIKSALQAGPTIVGNVRNSNTYNDWSEHWAIGNLKGLYGYSVSTYGVGVGKYANSSSYLTYDTTNGICLKNRTSGGLERIAIQLKQDGSGSLGNGFISWDTDRILQAGNWLVGQEKLYNGSTRLENSADFKGLAINNGSFDCMKIGDFSIPELLYSPTNLTATYVSNASFESGSFSSWTSTGSGATRQVAVGGAASGSWYALINCSNYTTLAFAYDLRQSFANPTTLQGKHIQIKIALALGSWSNSGNYPTVIAPVSVALANQSKTFAITSFTPGSSWSDFTLDATVPSDSTAVTLIISGNFASAQNYYSTMIDNVRVMAYDKSYSYISSIGFYFLNSPYNYFKMLGGAMSMGVSDLKVNGDPVSIYRGEFASGTPASPKGGDYYTSGNYLYFYNGSAWKRFVSA